ncbi:MAG: tyrosine-type recombinase/integrase [Actinomycetota bacterium]|nr:tyrosine-type recombinase/integrase [Actinomycetota bacterium]
MVNGWSTVRKGGPLAPYVEMFASELLAKGYTELTVTEHVRVMMHVSRWMQGEGLDAGTLTDVGIRSYCEARKAAGYTARLQPRSLAPLLAFLEHEGLFCQPAIRRFDPAHEELLEAYEAHLSKERGVVEAVVARWVQSAAAFLVANPALADGDRVLDASDVMAFCAQELPARSSSSAKELAAALRSFLRFLYVRGAIAAPLAQSIPPVASRRDATLPRGPSVQEIERLVASCDRRTRRGRRDRAILVLLARLGLRAGEVARLSLDDIDWRAGEIVVHGKGRRHDRLPLPDDVGKALVDYLHQSRPKSASREVFLRLIAPIGPLTPERITGVVHDACARAGVQQVGAHRLRHALATRMLGSGASLAEVGQVLRHSLALTTSLYAKVDVGQLAGLVRPWPGVER